MLRRVLPVMLLVGVAALFLPGCPKARSGSDLVLLLSVPELQVPGWENTLEAFTTATDIKVTIQNVPPDKYSRKLPSLLGSAAAPDVVGIASTDAPALIQRGVLSDLKPVLQGQKDLRLSDFTPWSLKPYQQQGSLYGLPYDLRVQALAYNQDLFELQNIMAPRQWTWAEYVAAAHKLTRDTNDDGQVDTWGTLAPPYWQMAVWQAGGDLVDNPTAPTRSTLSTPESQQGLQLLVDLIRKEKVAPGPGLADSPLRLSLFSGGEAAMAPMARGDVPTLDRRGHDIRWGLLPFPRDAQPANLGLSSAFCIPKTAAHPEQAAKLLLYLTGLDGQRQLANTGFLVPALEAVANSPEYFPPTSPAGDNVFLEGLKNARLLPITPAYPQMATIYEAELSKLWAGQVTVEEATKRIDEQINALLGQGKTARVGLSPLDWRG